MTCALRCVRAALVSAALVLSMPAFALVVSPASVRLWAPGGVDGLTPIDVTLPAVDTATGLCAGCGADDLQGYWMLPGESVQFVGDTIVLHLDAGDESTANPTTGYLGNGTDHAQYQFGSLMLDSGTLVGASIGASTGLLGGLSVSFVNGNQVNFLLDGLQFDTAAGRDANGYYSADVTITLQVQPVPEPPPLVLAAVGLFGFGALRRLRRR